MQLNEFIRRVRERTGLNHDGAVKLAAAVLRTLGERLDNTERKKLMFELPEGLRDCIDEWKSTHRFELEH